MLHILECIKNIVASYYSYTIITVILLFCYPIIIFLPYFLYHFSSLTRELEEEMLRSKSSMISLFTIISHMIKRTRNEIKPPLHVSYISIYAQCEYIM